jgi:hypothetical protein
MYQPQYVLTDKILNQVVEIERLTNTWKVREPAYAMRSKFEEQSKVANLFFLAHLLGSDITMNDAEKLLMERYWANF